jgi:CcmD family protein
MRLIRACILAVAVSLTAMPAMSLAQTPSRSQPPPGQEEFVPLSEIPPEEQIPAFTLVAIAYAAVWIVLLGYVWSLSRRLQSVETDLASLARKQ